VVAVLRGTDTSWIHSFKCTKVKYGI